MSAYAPSVTWILSKSRGLYFRLTGDSHTESAWSDEVRVLRASGYEVTGDDELVDWDPSAPDAHANCPSLDRTLRELKDLVGPIWRARVANIYAGRTPSDDETALSAHGPKGGMAAISFRYTYALLAAVITWGDFLQFVDRARDDPDVLTKAAAITDGLKTAFARLSDHGASALHDSKLLTVPSAQHARSAAQTQAAAEMWVIAHELAHHILRDATSRPDSQARERLDSYLSEADIQAELHGLSSEQVGEVRADVLALLLVAGEFSGDANPITELQAVMGALFGLLAVGLLNNDWLSTHDDAHPSTITRLAVIAKLAASRILTLDVLPADMREEQVRAIATVLAYSSWISGARIAADLEFVPESFRIRAKVAALSTALFVPRPATLFARPRAQST